MESDDSESQMTGDWTEVAFYPRNRDPHTSCTPYEHHVEGLKDNTHYNSFSLSLIWILWWTAQKWAEADQALESGEISEQEWAKVARYILLVVFTSTMMRDPLIRTWSSIPCPPEDVSSKDGPFYLPRSASEVLQWGPLHLQRDPSREQPCWALFDTWSLFGNAEVGAFMDSLMPGVHPEYRTFKAAFQALSGTNSAYTSHLRSLIMNVILSHDAPFGHTKDIPLDWRTSLGAALQCGNRTGVSELEGYKLDAAIQQFIAGGQRQARPPTMVISLRTGRIRPSRSMEVAVEDMITSMSSANLEDG